MNEKNRQLIDRYSHNMRIFNILSEFVLKTYYYCRFTEPYKEVFVAFAKAELSHTLLFDDLSDYEDHTIIVLEIHDAFQRIRSRLKQFESGLPV